MLSRLVLATGNAGKVQEFARLLAPRSMELLPQTQFGIVGPEETGLTFVENAILKARHAARASGLPALADDSGLEVDALQGAPGIRSARFAGSEASDTDNVALLLERLNGIPEAKRGARFHCALALLRHAEDPMPLLCQGSWEGRILTEPRGSGGFGYDPVFFALDAGCAAAELEAAAKNRISHRARALTALLSVLDDRQDSRAQNHGQL